MTISILFYLKCKLGMIQIRNKRDYEEQFQVTHILKCPKHTDHNKCFLMYVVCVQKETKKIPRFVREHGRGC
jgi:hypothetical protein